MKATAWAAIRHLLTSILVAIGASIGAYFAIDSHLKASWEDDSFFRGAFKKLAGLAHTANANDPPNESIPSQVSIAANQIMGETIPGTMGSCDPQDAVDLGIVEYWEVDLSLVAGSDNKCYEAKFPATYDGYFGTGVQGDLIRDHTFCVPLAYNTSYAQSDHNGGFAPDLYDNAVRIPATAASDWWFDPYAAVVTSETDLSLGATGTIRVYLWIGTTIADNVKKNNFGATAAPGSGDDEDDGYAIGSIWVDTDADEVYMCVLPTVASALWVALTGPTAADIADAVWDEAASGHVGAGSFGKYVADILTDTGGLNFTGGDVHATLDGETVALSDDAITLSKFDETTAWPLVAADSGATQVARVGADGDTLESLSGQLDSVSTFDPSLDLVNLNADQSGVTIGTVTTLTGHTAQTGDSYAIVNHTDHGNAKLCRSTTPANTLTIDGSGNAQANVKQIDGSAASADNLEHSTTVIVQGTATATTLTTRYMSTNLTETTDNHYNGRLLIWTSGALLNQAALITSYNGTTKTLGYTTTTEAPAENDTFVIL